jgi:DnaJ-class molecular chaperone
VEKIKWARILAIRRADTAEAVETNLGATVSDFARAAEAAEKRKKCQHCKGTGIDPGDEVFLCTQCGGTGKA